MEGRTGGGFAEGNLICINAAPTELAAHSASLPLTRGIQPRSSMLDPPPYALVEGLHVRESASVVTPADTG